MLRSGGSNGANPTEADREIGPSWPSQSDELRVCDGDGPERAKQVFHITGVFFGPWNRVSSSMNSMSSMHVLRDASIEACCR